ncbi:hypothetical protein [Kaistella jeonii]|uniref:CopG family transcriptional regulator n=1 Tax=Kaistella jeonii TaxID=266749 RepID=A0A0C1FDE2_9FLAO|nr:hypothetical protein [Kaistella jeonii]KIA85994.1 hypothetical protein OA86_14335 [Kaistella jeonii]SFC37881.1 hypothetical protein SAMN05421876_1179 [Kaistella jeonii]VEI96820.1 Uncharacterised protein [Kaistella jeonii]
MKVISLKLDEAIFSETENILKSRKKPRNRYINEAIHYYNQMQKREILKGKLLQSSLLVREDNEEVLKEFESLGDDN